MGGILRLLARSASPRPRRVRLVFVGEMVVRAQCGDVSWIFVDVGVRLGEGKKKFGRWFIFPGDPVVYFEQKLARVMHWGSGEWQAPQPGFSGTRAGWRSTLSGWMGLVRPVVTPRPSPFRVWSGAIARLVRSGGREAPVWGSRALRQRAMAASFSGAAGHSSVALGWT